MHMIKSNSFIEAARAGKNDFWRYVVTILLIMTLVTGSSLCLGMAALLMGQLPGSIEAIPPITLLVVGLIPFGFVLVGLWMGLRLLHGRPFETLVRPAGRFRWGLLALSAGIWLALAAGGDLALSAVEPGNYRFVFEPQRLIPYALLALLLLPIQVAGEELLVRSYLTQGFGLAGGYWAAWLVPAVIFGLLHGLNPEVGAYGILLTMPVYIGMGLLLGWVTLHTAGLELALGMHLANNLYGTLLVTAPSSALPAPALFRIGQYDPAAALVVFAITALVYLLVIRLLKI